MVGFNVPLDTLRVISEMILQFSRYDTERHYCIWPLRWNSSNTHCVGLITSVACLISVRLLSYKNDMHIIFESVLMLFTKKKSKLADACRSYSLPKLVRFLRHSVHSISRMLDAKYLHKQTSLIQCTYLAMTTAN